MAKKRTRKGTLKKAATAAKDVVLGVPDPDIGDTSAIADDLLGGGAGSPPASAGRIPLQFQSLFGSAPTLESKEVRNAVNQVFVKVGKAAETLNSGSLKSKAAGAVALDDGIRSLASLLEGEAKGSLKLSKTVLTDLRKLALAASQKGLKAKQVGLLAAAAVDDFAARALPQRVLTPVGQMISDRSAKLTKFVESGLTQQAGAVGAAARGSRLGRYGKLAAGLGLASYIGYKASGVGEAAALQDETERAKAVLRGLQANSGPTHGELAALFERIDTNPRSSFFLASQEGRQSITQLSGSEIPTAVPRRQGNKELARLLSGR